MLFIYFPRIDRLFHLIFNQHDSIVQFVQLFLSYSDFTTQKGRGYPRPLSDIVLFPLYIREAFPACVGGMQQLVRLVRIRLSQETLVQLFDLRIVM